MWGAVQMNVDLSRAVSLEAEQVTLGGLMLENSKCAEVFDLLTADDFFDAKNKIVFKTIFDLKNEDKKFDSLIIIQALKDNKQIDEAGGEVYIFEIFNCVACLENIFEYAKTVKEKSIARQAIICAKELIQEQSNLPTAITKLQELNNQSLFKKNKCLLLACRNADEIKPKPVNWIWSNYIPRGSVTIIAGDPAVGKSQLIAYIAAIVSSGGIWFDKNSCEQGEVFILSAEDNAESTIIPRLKAANANLSMIKIVDGAITNNKSNQENCITHFDLSRHLDQLENVLCNSKNPVSITIDPISSYLGNIDSHRNSEVRGLLAPLAKLAEKHNVAVVCIAHFNKNSQQSAMMRVVGVWRLWRRLDQVIL